MLAAPVRSGARQPPHGTAGRAPYTQFAPAPSYIKEWNRLDFLRRLSIADTFVQ
jgi:hypothetical protein